jgi:hypothetical protein
MKPKIYSLADRYSVVKVCVCVNTREFVRACEELRVCDVRIIFRKLGLMRKSFQNSCQINLKKSS